MKMRIEIIEKSTGEVVEVKNIETERQRKAFAYYWTMQCNSKDYTYKEVE